VSQSLEIGAQASVSRTVAASDLASALSDEHQDQFPDVFATARMVAFMELAAAQVLRSLLDDGELSVGVTIDVTHSAATALGETVRATATYMAREGKLYVIEVTAEDAAGEIGRGTHRRAIISTSPLLEGARRRRGQT
jgi:fluoroacetyl-CoA thioesterase